MWIARTGAPWRALPEEYGKWPGVHKRFMRWAKAGIWQMIFNTLAVAEDNEWIMLDSSYDKITPTCSRSKKKI